MKKVFILIFILNFPISLFSAVSERKVYGVIVSYNKNTVVLVQDNGKKVTVARFRIPEYYKLKRGKRVHATLDSKKLRKQIELKHPSIY